MISEKIIEEIIHTSEKEKFLSKIQILRFAKEIIETLENDTRNRFQKIRFTGPYWKDPEYATTEVKKGIISFNMETVYSSMKERNKLIDSYLTCNLEILAILIHEIQHLREPYKMMKSKTDNLLLKYGSIKYIQMRIRNMYPNISEEQFQRLYLKLYNFIPTERIADIDSYKILFDSVLNFPDFKEKNNIEFSIIRQAYILNNIGVYDKSKYPLYHYLKKIDRLDLTDKIEDIYGNELSLDEKLRIGLRLDSEDTNSFEKKIKAK